MIIVPNNLTKASIINTIKTDSILLLSDYLTMLLDQTNYMVASQTIITYFLSQHVKASEVDKVLSLVRTVYQENISIESLKQSSYPNSQWLAKIIDHLKTELTQHNLVHPDNIPNILSKLAVLDPVYPEIQYYGFSILKPNIEAFFKHYKIPPSPSSSNTASLYTQYFHSIDEEVKSALDWQQSGDNRHIVLLDNQDYSSILNRRYHSLSGQDYSDKPLILDVIGGISAPNPGLPIASLTHLYATGQYPIGYSLLGLLSKQFHMRQTTIPLDNKLSYIKQPMTNKNGAISATEAIRYIEGVCDFWRIKISSHPAIRKALTNLQTLSYCNISLPYTKWHKLFLQALTQIRTVQPTLSPLDVMGARLSEIWVLGSQKENWRQVKTLTALSNDSISAEQYDYLIYSADHIIFSLQKTGVSGEPLHLPEGINTTEYCHTMHNDSIALDTLIEPKALVDERIKGGISLIQDYASCPFKAYSRYRLKLFSKQPQMLGIQPHHYGTIAHRVLELIYQAIPDQQALHDFDEAQAPLIIERAWQELSVVHNLHPKLQGIVKDRLLHTTLKWLDTDKSRSDFSIHALEKAFKLNLGDHLIDIRIDRIDYEEGKPVLIDYKTGQVNITDTFHPTFHHPQMALYALTQTTLPKVAYAKLSHTGSSLQALDLSSESCVKKHSQARGEEIDDIDALKATWNERATNILNRYQMGIYHVAPINPSVCNLCDYQSLCRVYDQGEY